MDNDIILVAQVFTKNAMGQEIPEETERTVRCKESSVTRAEWASAGSCGVAPEYVVTTAKENYNNEKIAKYNNERFKIYRTYIKAGSDEIELYLGKRIGA